MPVLNEKSKKMLELKKKKSNDGIQANAVLPK